MDQYIGLKYVDNCGNIMEVRYFFETPDGDLHYHSIRIPPRPGSVIGEMGKAKSLMEDLITGRYKIIRE